MNARLTEIKSKLTSFYSYFKDDNILTVSEDKAVLPFAHLVYDASYHDKILLCIAVDYPQSIVVAQMFTEIGDTRDVVLGEPFYVSTVDGKTHLGTEAWTQWGKESVKINDITPASNTLH